MNRPQAPELAGHGPWFPAGAVTPSASAAPARGNLADLRGRVVVLVFWTPSDPHGVRVMEQFRTLFDRHEQRVQVAGVLTPRLPADRDPARVSHAQGRLSVPFPSWYDGDAATWSTYGAQTWPTVVVIDPEGAIAGAVVGEGHKDEIEKAVDALVEVHRERGTLWEPPAEPADTADTPETDAESNDSGAAAGAPADPGGPATDTIGELRYPAKVAVERGGARLAIADTGNNRVLIVHLDGRVEQVITGLRRPMGVRFDPRNDAVVIADAAADRVVTVPRAEGTTDATWATSLQWDVASPTDLLVGQYGLITVAELGRNRLWSVDTNRDANELAGTGHPGLTDGPVATKESLTHPAGLAQAPQGILVAEAGSSAIRVLTDSKALVTLLGKGAEYHGDADGTPNVARLAQPMAVAAAPDGWSIYVADTGNDKLKLWSGVDGELMTLPVEGLSFPQGLDVLPDGRLVVADSHNHRVAIVDLADNSVTTFVIDQRVPETMEPVYAGIELTAVAGEPVHVSWTAPLGVADLAEVENPVTLRVSALPPSLLAPHCPKVEHPSEWYGTMELPTGEPGIGSVLLEVKAQAVKYGKPVVIRQQRVHPIKVEPRPEPEPETQPLAGTTPFDGAGDGAQPGGTALAGATDLTKDEVSTSNEPAPPAGAATSGDNAASAGDTATVASGEDAGEEQPPKPVWGSPDQN